MPAPAIMAAIGLAAEFAPGLVRWLGGDKAGDVADDIAGIAESVTGTGDLDAARELMRANPELAMQFREAAAKREVELERMYLADRADARARDVALAQVGRLNARADIMVALAFAAVVIIAVLLAMGQVDASTAAGGFLIAVGGMFARNIGTAFDFEFGSSRGSKNKDAELAGLVKGAAREDAARPVNPFRPGDG